MKIYENTPRRATVHKGIASFFGSYIQNWDEQQRPIQCYLILPSNCIGSNLCLQLLYFFLMVKVLYKITNSVSILQSLHHASDRFWICGLHLDNRPFIMRSAWTGKTTSGNWSKHSALRSTPKTVSNLIFRYSPPHSTTSNLKDLWKQNNRFELG